MALPRHVWDQVKNLTAEDLKRALERDGWVCEGKSGAVLAFTKQASVRRRVTVHYHPGKSYGAKLLQGLLDDIGWNDADLKRLKLIK